MACGILISILVTNAAYTLIRRGHSLQQSHNQQHIHKVTSTHVMAMLLSSKDQNWDLTMNNKEGTAVVKY